MKKNILLTFFITTSSHLFSQIPSSGNILWLMADRDVYTDNGITLAAYGQLTEVWKDQSGNGNDFTQPVSGRRPQLVVQAGAFCGKPALRFDINRRTYLSSTLKSSGPKTIFIVFKLTSLANNSQSLFTIKGLSNTYTEILGTDNPGYRSISYMADIPGSPTGGTMLNSTGINASFSNSGNILTMTYDGGTITTPTCYTSNYDATFSAVSSSGLFGRLLHDTTSIGARVPEQNYCFLSGDIAEIIVYDRVLNSSEIADVESYLITKYGFFNTCVPLETRMTDFTASLRITAVLLKWEVTNENNVACYIAERSTDNRTWQQIGSRVSVNSGTKMTKYELFDLSPMHGLNYYRIKTKTNDDNYIISEVRVINSGVNAEKTLYIIPSPATDYFIIQSPNSEPLYVIIADSYGRIKKRINTFSNTPIEIQALSAGIYFLRAENKTGIKNYKLVKK